MIPSYASTMHAAVKQAINLRYYQHDLINEIHKAWASGAKGVMAVLATGGGKTVVFGRIVASHKGASCSIAHRQELVSQISLALARYGVRHKIIGPKAVVQNIVSLHVREVGTNFIHSASKVAVAGVDTLIRKGKLVVTNWLKEVTLVVHDEGHHLLADNKWGKATDLFTNPLLKLLSVTATPERADGRGLGRHADGLIDVMVEGPGVRQLINEGYLSEYRVIMAESDIVLSQDMISAETGEFIQAKLKAAVRGSHIVGDVVKAYQKYTPGERALVFASDTETSADMAESFRRAGIKALHVDADSSDEVRIDAVKKLKDNELQVLCNVGLFGEGFDLPVVVAVYDTAATESFSNYAQRFARMLRISVAATLIPLWETFTPDQRKAHIAASAKPYGVYVDLVGNLIRHRGPPDKPRQFTLDSREKRGRSGQDGPPVTYCKCGKTYERFYACCPFCGFKPEPTARSAPEFVDGDWRELDAETLARMRGEMIDVDSFFIPVLGVPHHIALKHLKDDAAKKAAQVDLRDAFAWWAGERRSEGMPNEQIIRLFYHTFKIDTLSAWALGRAEAVILTERVHAVLTPTSQQARLLIKQTNEG